MKQLTPHSSLLTPNFKIDLVYLWVDGNDEKWRAKKNKFLKAEGRELNSFAVGSTRWDENEELKFSLRSAAQFAPWINHIYIVTDGQIPSWLDLGNSRVSIVDHKDIIPEKYLPLFNSAAIELFIHKIPGLSEYFLYANDDCFFGDHVKPEFFFDKSGAPLVMLKEKKWPRKIKRRDMFSNMVANGIELIEKKFGRRMNFNIKHTIEPMRKSYMEQKLRDLESDLDKTTFTRFRDNSNVQRIMLPLYDNVLGRNEIMCDWHLIGFPRMRAANNTVGRTLHKTLQHLSALIGLRRPDVLDNPKKFLKSLKKFRPSVFCIPEPNDNDSAFPKVKKQIEGMFPNESEFERRPKISIIMPAFNVEKYLAETLESILNQNYKNLEIIIIEDGSTDSTLEIAHNFAQKDPRIKIIVQENSGVAAARNRGIEIADGEYVHFHDSDDKLMSPDYYNKMIGALMHTDADIAYGGFVDQKRPKRPQIDYKKFQVITRQNIRVRKARIVYYAHVWRYMLRRDFILKHDMEFEKGRFLEDVLFTIPAVYKANKIVLVPGALYWYRRTPGGIIRDEAKKTKRKIDKDYALSKTLDFSIGHGFSLGFRRGFWRKVLRFLGIIKRVA
jgi:glycosyltransferase involved in cell wall biosynthesis